MLTLTPIEVTVEERSCCGTNKKRFPYSELGSTDINTACGCCHGFGTDKFGANPGCACAACLGCGARGGPRQRTAPPARRHAAAPPPVRRV